MSEKVTELHPGRNLLAVVAQTIPTIEAMLARERERYAGLKARHDELKYRLPLNYPNQQELEAVSLEMGATEQTIAHYERELAVERTRHLWPEIEKLVEARAAEIQPALAALADAAQHIREIARLGIEAIAKCPQPLEHARREIASGEALFRLAQRCFGELLEGKQSTTALAELIATERTQILWNQPKAPPPLNPRP